MYEMFGISAIALDFRIWFVVLLISMTVTYIAGLGICSSNVCPIFHLIIT